jgi:hypothetical protein
MAGHRPSTSGWWAEGPSPTCEVRGLFPAVVPGNVGDLQYPVSIFILEVLKIIFIFCLGPLSPGGSRGRVRSTIFLRKSSVLGRFRFESGDF